MVYCDGMTGGVFRSKPEELRSYVMCFEALRAAALSPKDSVDIISQVARGDSYQSIEERMWPICLRPTLTRSCGARALAAPPMAPVWRSPSCPTPSGSGTPRIPTDRSCGSAPPPGASSSWWSAPARSTVPVKADHRGSEAVRSWPPRADHGRDEPARAGGSVAVGDDEQTAEGQDGPVVPRRERHPQLRRDLRAEVRPVGGRQRVEERP